MKKSKSIISLIISFITMITIIIMVLLSMLNITLFNPAFVTKIIKTTNYSDLLYLNINKDVTHLLEISGIPNEISKNVITSNMVLEDSCKYFESIFSGDDFEFNSTNLKINVKNAINIYAYSQNLDNVNTTQLNKNIDELTKKVVITYDNYVNVSVIKPVNKIVEVFSNYKLIAFIILIGLLVLEIVFLILINKNTKKILKYLIYSLLGSCFFMAITATATTYTGIISRIPVTNQSQYILAVAALERVLNSIWVNSIILLVISMILLIIYIAIKDKNKRYRG